MHLTNSLTVIRNEWHFMCLVLKAVCGSTGITLLTP
ncbi:DUF3265 domain-containing protein [Aeromonas caviae]|nr:DUF3265 domain-containing protein [Aeromonas caviae]RWT07701.1 DUF3265 domain-containing protein [Aeromonas caviae]